MARGINKVILVGYLGKDPEVRYSPQGQAVATVSVATTESWKDKDSGEKIERVEWHRVVMFGRLAEVAGEYLKKGAQIYVEGRLQTRKWQDKDGNDRYTTEVVANEMQMLGGRPGAMESSAATGASHPPRQPARAASAAGSSANPPPADFDDDIPFDAAA